MFYRFHLCHVCLRQLIYYIPLIVVKRISQFLLAPHWVSFGCRIVYWTDEFMVPVICMFINHNNIGVRIILLHAHCPVPCAGSVLKK